VHRIVQQAVAAGAVFVDVLQRADDAGDLAVAAEHRLHAHAEGAVVAVVGAEADVVETLPRRSSTSVSNAVLKRSRSSGWMRSRPALDGAAERAAPFAKRTDSSSEMLTRSRSMFQSKTKSPEPGERQGAALDFAERADRHLPFGEGVLHRGEAEQHDDEHETTGDGRLGDVVGDLPGDHQPAVEQPGDEDDPGGAPAAQRGRSRARPAAG